MTLNFRPARVIRLVLILLAVVLAVWAAKTYIWPCLLYTSDAADE